MAPTTFKVRGEYRRDEVADLIGMPPARRGGNWDTGYDQWNGEFFLFCNVGVPGRTGHDYRNRWVGSRLSWFAKNGTRLGQPQIESLLAGKHPVHVFWRGKDRAPFTYAGQALAEQVADTTPVEVIWIFETEYLPEAVTSTTPLWKRGPSPSFGSMEIHKQDGPTNVYLMVLKGASEVTFPTLPPGWHLAKVGMSNDCIRRVVELNSGFPPGCALKWTFVRARQYSCGAAAYAAEGELLEQFRAQGQWVGGEFVYASPQQLEELLA